MRGEEKVKMDQRRTQTEGGPFLAPAGGEGKGQNGQGYFVMCVPPLMCELWAGKLQTG